MFDVRSPRSGHLSPDGTRLFFNWSVTGTSQVWRLDGPQRFPVQLTGGEDPTVLEAVMPDGQHIVVSRDRGGAETPGLYLQPAAGGPLEPIFQQDGVRTFFGHVSPDGTSIVFTANDRRPDSYAVYRYDVATGRTDLLFGEEGLWFLADHRPDGRLLLAKATGNTTSEFFGYDPDTRVLTPYLGQGEREDYDVEFGLADGELVVRTPKFGDFQRLYRYRLDTGEFAPLTPADEHDVEDFSVSDEGGRVLYTVNEDGYTRPHALDARTSATLVLPPFATAADHVSFGATTLDGRYTAMQANGATAPPSSSVLDWTTGRLVQWHVPSAPEIDPGRFAPATLESYPARDGTPIPMFVRRPARCAIPAKASPAAAPCPVVVEFHGGPEGQARPGWDPGAQLYVDAGFVHVSPNVRGSTGYGKAWLHADNGPRRLDVITDIEYCARFVRRAWALGGKPPKLGVTGASYGGYSALVAMTMFAAAYDAGVAAVGMSDLATFLANTAAYRRALRVTEYGDPKEDADALRRLSPITYLDRVEGPLLIIQGANDPRVPASEALQMQAALERAGAGSRLILFADEGHGSQKRDNRVQEVGHTLQFFIEHLLAR